MESESSKAGSIYDLVGWLDQNKKLLGWCGGILVAGGLVYSFASWRASAREIAASEAMSNLRPTPNAGGTVSPIPSSEFLRIAEEYSGTQAGGRALLLGAASLFGEEKYDQAIGGFDRFLRDFPASTLAPQALLGLAACLEAQGKQAEALTRYQSVAERYPHGSVVTPARAAMARLYESQNKPQDALRIYQELARNEAGGSYALEAGIRMEDLLVKNPALRTNSPPFSTN